jgi:hypothetical protein
LAASPFFLLQWGPWDNGARVSRFSLIRAAGKVDAFCAIVIPGTTGIAVSLHNE